MKYFNFLFILLFAIGVLAEVPEHLYLKTAPPVQLPNAARYMVYLETNANPVGVRSAKPFWIEHLEIPLTFLEQDKGFKLNKLVYDSMVFTNANGEKIVRWILNPEDTQYGEELIADLKEKGLEVSRKRHFIGYSTSSRSCIVQDPVTGTAFSIKSSTNQTAGSWNDKKETVRAARAGRLMSDHIALSRREAQNKTLGIVSEPLAFYMAGADQGIIIRQYDHFFKSAQDVKLVPVFAFVHRAEYYAKQAGFKGSLQDFIQQTLVKMGGKVSAELFINYGIVYNSPHGQNFLVEVDKNEKPTGHLYARDYADSHLFEPIFKRTAHGRATLAHYKTFTSGSNQILNEYSTIAFGPYYDGTRKVPAWVTSEDSLSGQFKESLHERLLETLRLNNPGANFSSNSVNYGYWGEGFRLDEVNNKDLGSWLRKPVYNKSVTVPPAQPVIEMTHRRPSAPAVRMCRVLFSAS